MLADGLSRSWGQPVIVDNRPGAGGIIAINELKRSGADGYTYTFAEVGILAINPLYYPKLPYDPAKELLPVTDLIWNDWVLFTSKESPVKSLRDLITMAKAKPGSLSFASPGTGTPIWAVSEALKLRAGIDLLHVPFKDVSALVNTVASGEVTVYFTTLATMQPVIAKVTPIAVASRQRMKVLPQVPTVEEAGGPAGFDIQGWALLTGLRGIPAPILAKVRTDAAEVMNRPEIRGKLNNFGLDVSKGMTSEALEAFIRGETEKYRQVITATGARGEL
jgi:tripartite-type tricarboxylate transporter receptor subunit TctC